MVDPTLKCASDFLICRNPNHGAPGGDGFRWTALVSGAGALFALTFLGDRRRCSWCRVFRPGAPRAGSSGGAGVVLPASDFGALPMRYGTAMVAGVALAFAVPVGLGAAVFSVEILPARARLGFKAALELLAGIPSVVYGLLGILFLRNWVYDLFAPWEPASGDTLLTAGLLVGVMILPTLMTLADDALAYVGAAQPRGRAGSGADAGGDRLGGVAAGLARHPGSHIARPGACAGGDDRGVTGGGTAGPPVAGGLADLGSVAGTWADPGEQAGQF